ncbi:MAG TPA: pyridoxamine 5'-phosphate oxidase family protein [Candidatus Bathyarchaeia archaeon]|nr:pyridoxamine 5'-phosphate oxidase family protein [Candidatus Bathyarchaeia archaeon]
MSEQESNNFLSNGRILRVASVGSDGTPHIAPIWYVYENGKFYVQTGPRSRKAQNIKANSKVAFSVDVGERFYDLKAVIGKGTARILTERKFNDEIGKRILLKYLGDLNDPAAKQLANLEHIVIEITPTTKTSLDYSKNR